MKKIIALVLVLLVALPMALALTKADLTNFGKVSRVSPVAASTPTLNLAKLLGIDQIRSGHVRLPPEAPCVTQATPETFNSLVLEETSKPVAVRFYADWCGPCRLFAPIYDQACNEYKSRMKFVAFNIDQDRSMWTTYDIPGIPAVLFFNDGSEVYRSIGYISIERFRGVLNSVLRNLGL